MANKDILENIDSNLEEIHRDYFFGGRKRRERHNFLIGLLIGVGLAFMIEAGIQLYLNQSSINFYSSILQNNNLTIKNLPFSDQLDYSIRLSNNLHLLSVIGIGFFILVISFLYYSSINKHLFNHIIRYSYKLDDKEKLSDIAERIACVFKQVRSEKRFKWVGGKVSYDPLEQRVNVKFYHKIKKLLLLEYDNKLFIGGEKIIIFCQTSDFGENFGLLIDEFFKELKKNKVLKELKREGRT